MLTDADVVCCLRRLRIRAGQSQEAVIEGANWYIDTLEIPYPKLDRVSLSKAENESIILIPAHVYAIAAFLDCSMHDIYPMIYPEEPAG
jgi:hypothetical protein